MRQVITGVVWLGGLAYAAFLFEWTAWPALLWLGGVVSGVLLLRTWWHRRRREFAAHEDALRPSCVRVAFFDVVQVCVVIATVQAGLVLQSRLGMSQPEAPLVDADRTEFEYRIGVLEEAGRFDQAAKLLEERLFGGASDAWKEALATRLYRDLLEAGKTRKDLEGRSQRFARAIEIGKRFGLDTNAAILLEEKCRRALRFEEQLAEFRKRGQWTSVVTMLEAALLDEHSAEEVQVLAAGLRDALVEGSRPRPFKERKELLAQAQAVCTKHGLVDHGPELELLRLEREVAEKIGPIALSRKCKAEVLKVSRIDSSGGVIADVWLESESGEFLDGLSEKDFKVYWEGRLVTNMSVRCEGQSETSQPWHFLLAIDTSGSMEGPAIDAAKAGAKQLLGRLGSLKGPAVSSWVKVLSFSDGVQVACDWTQDFSKASAAVDGLKAEGSTALLKAVAHSTEELEKRSGMKHALVFSDGKDTVGGLDAGDVIKAAKKSGIPFSVVALRTAELDDATLQLLAKETAGEYREAAEPENLVTKFGQACRLLRPKCYRLVFITDQTGPAPAPGVVVIGGVNAIALPLVPYAR